ncbi:MAG: hypothetical protein COB20_04850 [SAR86 cluster bacterium]|uniref:DUF2306 domain-containing protein n=1 Tax=SAR86 cluster bacterium TaxID=2030880 RepID=A0A2A4XBD0_9GAMM|nr:MAG: hypothetical protein COB20_04850 [SAR86 cluster bacterium]
MSDLTAGEATPSKAPGGMDFSAAPMPAIRKVLEIVGWGLVALLVFTGLSAIFSRTDFMIGAFSEPIANPEEVFNAFDIRYYTNAMATVLHLGPGFFVMVLGPLQFMRGVRKKHINLHRISGRVFVLCGTIGAFSGIAIGVFDPFMGVGDQGFNESMATAFFSVYILFSLVMAIVRIKQRNFGQHREWMIRAFALMLAIATERLMLSALMATTGIDIAVLFGTTFWMAAVTNIGAAELWINFTRTPGNGARHWKDMDAKAAKA